MTLEAEEFLDLPSASWSPREVGGIIQSESEKGFGCTSTLCLAAYVSELDGILYFSLLCLIWKDHMALREIKRLPD